MNPIVLLIPALLASAPSIEWALAQRTGRNTATLWLLKADRRLQAVCFDPDGLDPAVVEHAKEAAAEQPIWLYLGPRRVAQGRVEAFDSAATPAGPCAVTARATFDETLPLVAAGDVLWASTTKERSEARRPILESAIDRARRALPPVVAACFSEETPAVARGTEGGTYVGFVGEADCGTLSAIAVVPRDGPATLVALEPGRLSLVDVLDPHRRRGHTLALVRETDGARRLELWRALASGLERLGAEGEF